jgi:hypothetical protein
MIKALQSKVNVGIEDCKKALKATNGNIDKAKDWLIQHGTASKNKIKERGVKAFLVNLAEKTPLKRFFGDSVQGGQGGGAGGGSSDLSDQDQNNDPTGKPK